MSDVDLTVPTLTDTDLQEPATATPADIRRQWLEARVRSLYTSALTEEIPEELTALVLRLGRAN